MVYLYLSVAFIQMLKAAAPVSVLLLSWAWGIEKPNLRVFLNVLAIVFGVALASLGEIEFNLVGFILQVGGILFESLRLIIIQTMMSEDGQRMDPLVSLYYYAPVCAAMNFVVAWLYEWGAFQWDDMAKTGFFVLFLNAAVAFLLNVSSVFLIDRTSSLVMTLAGILKNIVVVVASVAIWATEVSMLQVVGYALALGGLVNFSLGWERIKLESAAVASRLGGFSGVLDLDINKLSPVSRNWLTMGAAFLMIFMMTSMFAFGYAL
ncbi:putative triose-phosphate transporter [Phaeomoniella chlamydospora]|uniref:Putative triose-phosphate transporter n=1 Tax=Phaeomoniella chlamydospora TaxID=158046 RepID=A0A0G2F4M4_PHACM|nr:putative triose-phosphate transporter [Phaeomoniella chlamydospora]